MYKAKNEKLFQEANLDVAEIRQTEINYYTGIYKSFAYQGSLLSGFTFYFLRKIEGDHRWLPDLDSWYAFFATGTILTGVQLVLCCLYLLVYGPGLAIYGPPGSMARACAVLKREQPMIVKTFIVLLAFFVTTLLSQFWHKLDYFGALICSIAVFGALFIWYRSVHRIYSQLIWKDDAVFDDITRGSISPADKLEMSNVLEK